MHLLRSDIPPAALVEDVKAYGRVEHDLDDPVLQALIASVTTELCTRTATALVHETITVTWDTWSRGAPLSLPIGPLSEANGATITVTQTIETTGAIAAIETIEAINLTTRHGDRPTLTVNASPQGPLTVTYTAGHGPDASAVPLAIRAAVGAQTMHIYDGADVETTQRRLSPAYASALHQRQRVTI